MKTVEYLTMQVGDIIRVHCNLIECADKTIKKNLKLIVKHDSEQKAEIKRLNKQLDSLLILQE